MFIPKLYMFRALVCLSSGKLIVSVRHLVYVTQSGDRRVCRFSSSTQTCIPDSHLHKVTYNRRRIDAVDSPDDEHISARNM
jgi:hypothetical protein